MAKTDPARPRRTPPARPGHREPKALLALGTAAAILAGWLVLAREVPVASTASPQPVASGAAPASVSARQVGQARPRPITRTRSSR